MMLASFQLEGDPHLNSDGVMLTNNQYISLSTDNKFYFLGHDNRISYIMLIEEKIA